MADEMANNEAGEAKPTTASKPMNIWKPIAIVMTILFLVTVAIYLFMPPTGAVIGAALTPAQAGDIAATYIQNNLVSPTVSVNVTNVTKVGNFYQINILLSAGTASQNVESYLSLDGRYFFPSGYDLTAPTTTVTTTTVEPVPKTDKPTVQLYVMSYCPYGNQAEDTLLPVYNLLKDKVNFNVSFIVSVSGDTVSSLHGANEVTEDEREAFILSQYGFGKWMTFAAYVNANCGSASSVSCWEAAANAAGLNPADITAGVAAKGLSLMKDSEAASNAVGATGSPTMLINGVESTAVYQYGDSEAYKQAICNAFTTAPAECATVLSSSTNSASAGGSCATTV